MAFIVSKRPELVTEAWDWVNGTASGSVCACRAPAILGSVVINGGTLGAITVYNNTAASGQTVASISAPSGGQVFWFNAFCSAGVAVQAAAATNFTVTFNPKVD